MHNLCFLKFFHIILHWILRYNSFPIVIRIKKARLTSNKNIHSNNLHHIFVYQVIISFSEAVLINYITSLYCQQISPSLFIELAYLFAFCSWFCIDGCESFTWQIPWILSEKSHLVFYMLCLNTWLIQNIWSVTKYFFMDKCRRKTNVFGRLKYNIFSKRDYLVWEVMEKN